MTDGAVVAVRVRRRARVTGTWSPRGGGTRSCVNMVGVHAAASPCSPGGSRANSGQGRTRCSIALGTAAWRRACPVVGVDAAAAPWSRWGPLFVLGLMRQLVRRRPSRVRNAGSSEREYAAFRKRVALSGGVGVARGDHRRAGGQSGKLVGGLCPRACAGCSCRTRAPGNPLVDSVAEHQATRGDVYVAVLRHGRRPHGAAPAPWRARLFQPHGRARRSWRSYFLVIAGYFSAQDGPAGACCSGPRSRRRRRRRARRRRRVGRGRRRRRSAESRSDSSGRGARFNASERGDDKKVKETIANDRPAGGPRRRRRRRARRAQMPRRDAKKKKSASDGGKSSFRIDRGCRPFANANSSRRERGGSQGASRASTLALSRAHRRSRVRRKRCDARWRSRCPSRASWCAGTTPNGGVVDARRLPRELPGGCDDHTPEDARVMAWWDYGYQINGIANRTTLADGNTWNHEHIALLGQVPHVPGGERYPRSCGTSPTTCWSGRRGSRGCRGRPGEVAAHGAHRRVRVPGRETGRVLRRRTREPVGHDARIFAVSSALVRPGHRDRAVGALRGSVPEQALDGADMESVGRRRREQRRVLYTGPHTTASAR